MFLVLLPIIMEAMKSLAALILVLSFLGTGIFGFWGMEGWHGYLGCMSALLAGEPPCPADNILAYVNFHVNAFKALSEAAFGDVSFAAALAFLVLFLSLGAGFLKSPGLKKKLERLALGRLDDSPEKIFRSKAEFLSWLAFHENSPAAVSGAPLRP